MSKPIKILFVHGGTLEKAGTEAFMMNVLRNIDREKFHIDFMVFGRKEGAHDKEVITSGSKIFRIPYTPGDLKLKDASFRLIRKMIKDENYQIVHAHMNALNAVILSYMKRIGIPVRISHSHGSRHFVESKVIISVKERLKTRIPKVATHLLSCSTEAGDFLYGDHPYLIMNNGIDTETYKFNKSVRKTIREELGLDNKFTLGHVGRFNFQKNHKFLIDVFNEYYQLDPSSHLVLVGDGELRKDIEHQITTLNLNEHVSLLGIRDNINELYQAMDAFVLPSLFEGLPYVLVEAQCSGLLSISADTVDEKSKLIDDFYFLTLHDPKEWARIIFENRNVKRHSSEQVLRDKGYDVKENVKWLMNLYEEAVEELDHA